MDSTIVVPKDPPLYLLLTIIIAATGGLLFGYDTGVISGALPLIQSTFQVDILTQEIIVSAVIIGALIGALSSGRLVDYYGSQRILRYVSITFLVGTILSCLAPSVAVLISARAILGIAIGIISYVSPLFIAEMAPAHQRGKLVLLNGLMITAGEALAFLVDYLLLPTQSWRLMFAASVIPALILLTGSIFLPASPRWLALNGLHSEALAILKKVRGTTQVTDEYNVIMINANQSKSKLIDCFSSTVRPAIAIGITLGMMQQFVGINTIMYYGPTVFSSLGFDTGSGQLLSTFAMGVINTITTIITITLVDKLGRRRLLMTGLLLASTMLVSIGYLCSDPFYPHWISLILLVGYIVGYSMSLGSLFWLIISEIFPLNIRASGMSICATAQWTANIIVSISFLSMLNYIGIQNTFYFYAMMCMLSLVFCNLFVPETMGLSLEQIEHELKLRASFKISDHTRITDI